MSDREVQEKFDSNVKTYKSLKKWKESDVFSVCYLTLNRENMCTKVVRVISIELCKMCGRKGVKNTKINCRR